MEISQLRQQQYWYHKDHDKSPYTWFKARFYMEFAARLVYLLQYTKIQPNNVTYAYLFTGLLGGMLLSMPNRVCVYVALVIFYFRGVLDWSDGHLARIKGKVTEKGRKMDILAGKVGILSFYLGFGIFLSYFYGYFTVPWVFAFIWIVKKLGVPVTRACFVDSIILLVGIINTILTF